MENEIEISDPPKDSISSVVYSSDSQHLLVSSWDNTLSLYSKSALQFRHRSPSSILDCTFFSSTQAVFGGLDSSVSLVDLVTGAVSVLGSHAKPIKSVKHHSGLIFSGSWDRTLQVWDSRSSPSNISSTFLPGKVYSMSMNEVSDSLVVATSNKDLLVFDFRNMLEPVSSKQSPLKYQTRCVECMPNGEGFCVTSIEGRAGLEFFNNPETRNFNFKCHRGEEDGRPKIFPVNTASFHPQEGTFATGGSDRHVVVWDGIRKKKIWKLREFPAPVACLAFSPDGSQLAIACSYLFEEGDIPNQPPSSLFLRQIEASDVAPKP